MKHMWLGRSKECVREFIDLDVGLTTYCLIIVLLSNVVHDKVKSVLNPSELYKIVSSSVPVRVDYADDTTVYLANGRIKVDRGTQEITFAETLFSDHLMETQTLSIFMRIFKLSMKTLEEYFAQGKRNQSYVLGVLLPLYEIIAKQYGLPDRAKMDLLQVAISPTEKVEFENYVLNMNYIVQTINTFLKAHGYSSILSFECKKGVCEEPVTEVIRYSDAPQQFPKTVQQDIQAMLKQSPALRNLIPSELIKEVYDYEEISGYPGAIKSFQEIPKTLYRNTANKTEDYLLYYGAFYHQYCEVRAEVQKHAHEHEDIVANWEDYTVSILTMRAILEHPNMKERENMLADLFVSFEKDGDMESFVATVKKAWKGNLKEAWTKEQWLHVFKENGTEGLKQFIVRSHLPEVGKALSWFKEVVDIGMANAFKQHCGELSGSAVPYGSAEKQYPCT